MIDLVFSTCSYIYKNPNKSKSRYITELSKRSIWSYSYRKSEGIVNDLIDRGGFENDIFLVNPYYWGENADVMDEPNFVLKPSGLTIDWYKYPFRDSYSNMKLTLDELKDILVKCKENVIK